MKKLILFFTLILGFGALITSVPDSVQASLASCNPTIQRVSGTSNVWGVNRSAQAPGPGIEVAQGGAPESPSIGPWISMETVQIGGLDATSGMTYRGNGVWQDSSGNRLSLAITPGRTPFTDSLGGSCSGSLQGPIGGLQGLPGGFSVPAQAQLAGGWRISGGQIHGLRVVANVNIVSAPTPTPTPTVTPTPTPTPTNTSPGRNVSMSANPICNGNTGAIRINWNYSGPDPREAVSFDIEQDGVVFDNVPGSWHEYITGATIPGRTYRYRVIAKRSNGTILASSVVRDAVGNSCGTSPGNFTLSGSFECINDSPVANINWTAASGVVGYQIMLGVGDQLQQVGVNSADDLDFAYYRYANENEGAAINFRIYASNPAGVTESNTLPLVIPDCSPDEPDPTITLNDVNSVCTNGNPRNVLSWSTGGSSFPWTGYRILRDGQELTIENTTTYTDETVTNGTQYRYQVEGVYQSEVPPPGGSVPQIRSNEVSINTRSCPQRPGAFTLITSSVCENFQVSNHLEWTASQNAVQYQVYKDTDTSPLTTSTGRTFIDRDITQPSHNYFIRAINAAGTTDTAIASQETPIGCHPLPNDPPIANDDSANTPQDVPVTIAVLGNDTDPDDNLDRDSLSLFPDQPDAPDNGTVSVESGSVIYTPNNGFVGEDRFTYSICDTEDLCDQAIVTVTVAEVVPVNPPGEFTVNVQAICAGQTAQHIITWTSSEFATSYSVYRDGVLLGTSAETNFVDENFVTNPATEYNYYIQARNSDGEINSNVAIITSRTCQIEPTPTSTPTPTPVENEPPQANDDTASVNQNSFVVIDVLDNDVDPDGTLDPACLRITTQPENGTTIIDTNNGLVAYTPTVGFSGTDTFNYEICDNDGATDSALVTISVIPPSVPDTLDAVDDVGETPHNTALDLDVLLNDTGTGLNPACLKIVRQPNNGLVVVNQANGRVNYTPTQGFSGTDTFAYEICDANNQTDTATVSVAVGQAPPATLAATGNPFFDFFANLWYGLLGLLGLR